MPGYRLWMPAIPASALLAGLVLGRAYGDGRVRWASLGLLCAVLLPALDSVAQYPMLRASGDEGSRIAADLANELSEAGGRVALVDVGYLGYVGDLDVIDLGAVTDPELAYRPGGHLAKEIDPAWIELQNPDSILLHSSVPPVIDEGGELQGLRGYPVEMQLATMPWIRSNFRVFRSYRYHASYHYVWLRRRDAREERLR